MNFLFGLAIAIPTAAIVWVLLWTIPETFWLQLPDEFRIWKKPVINTLAALVLLIVLWSSLATYGPRIELQDSMHQPQPTKTEINSGEAWSNTEDRRGNADELLEEAPVRAKELEPADEN